MQQVMSLYCQNVIASNIEFDDSELALGLYYDMNDVVKAVAAKVS